MRKVYMSDDGKIFNTERECRDWEMSLRLDEANMVLKNHIILFRYDRELGLVEVPYKNSNRVRVHYAYVKQMSCEDERYERDYVDELYSKFIPWELGEAIENYDRTGWYVLDGDADKWTHLEELESRLKYLETIKKDIAELSKMIETNY